jgi:hypothetical protein
MSSTSLITNKKAIYVPWVRPMTRSDSKVRAQNRVLPADAFTCWDVNSVCSHKVHSCAACDLFLCEKALISHLRKLSSNKDAPSRYRCKSPWTEDQTEDCSVSTPVTAKRKSSQDIQNATPATPKKTKRSRRTPHTQSPLPAVAQDANSPSDSLSGYLMKRLATRDQQVDYLENERYVLKEQLNYYLKESGVIHEKVLEWKRELCESKKQVLHLHALLASKVESLASKVELL